MVIPKIATDWLSALGDEFQQPYLQKLLASLRTDAGQGKIVYPPEEQVFNALRRTSLSSIRVVILGQDPYHGPGQANGLAFSVASGQRLPPSLRNIFRELADCMGTKLRSDGDLSDWADQGVLLLNRVLTVEQGKPGSHQNRGWERLTDRIIEAVAAEESPKVFLLWGAQARQQAARVSPSQHLVLTAPHPSPLSAYRGFFGCRHFALANAFLQKQGREPVAWG